MNQIAFDFDVDAPQALPKQRFLTPAQQEAYWAACREEELAEAREHWTVGMVTSLPLFSKVLDSAQTYTQMLPGVIESIADDKAAVRIYAAPEYGCWLEDYPLHRKLAVDVPLVDLGKYGCDEELERIVAEGRLATGDAELAVRIRGRKILKGMSA